MMGLGMKTDKGLEYKWKIESSWKIRHLFSWKWLEFHICKGIYDWYKGDISLLDYTFDDDSNLH